MSNYLEGKKMILDSEFKIKNLETFRGHDGTGINADIYHGKNRIAFVHDSAYVNIIILNLIKMMSKRIKNGVMRTYSMKLLRSL